MVNEKSNPSSYSNMLSNLLNNIPYSAFCKNSKHEIVALNDFSAEIYGYTRKDMIGKCDYDFFLSSECAVFQRVDNEVFSTGNIIANREVVTDKSGYIHHINTKKGKIRTKQGDELVIGISYTRDDSNLYDSDTHQDEYFNNNTLECIEKLTDTFNSLNIESESNRRYFQTLNIDNAYHLLSRDKEFLNEFINRIPYYACYVSDHSNEIAINNKLERFINDSRGLKNSTIDNTNNFQELNNILFYRHHSDSKQDEDNKIIDIAGVKYLHIKDKIHITGVMGQQHGILHVFDLLPLDYDENIDHNYYQKNLKYDEFFTFIKDLKQGLGNSIASFYKLPITQLSISKCNSIEEINEIENSTKSLICKLDKSLKQNGITYKEWQALNVIVKNPYSTPSMVSKELNTSNSNTTKILDILEDKGYINRRHQKSDRRTVRLWFSSSGHQKWLMGKKIAQQIMKK